MAQLTCDNLTIGYEGKGIIEHINMKIARGDYLCILGENGTGKTTLMKTLLGLQKTISGRITLGEGLTRKKFGYLTQQSELQKDFPCSVREIVLSGCQSKSAFRPFYTKSEKKLAVDAMERLKIAPLKRKCFRELSGGQQQRVLLARALCATEEMLFLDEPVAGLDLNVSAEFYQMIADLNRESNCTIVMISHDVETALQYATHILHLGAKVFFGTKEEYLQDDTSLVFQKRG